MNKLIDISKQFYEFFNGKKTFIVGGLMVILGLMTDNKEMIMTGLGFLTLRSAIK